MFGREQGKKFAITGKQEEQPATHDLQQPAIRQKYTGNTNTKTIQIQYKYMTIQYNIAGKTAGMIQYNIAGKTAGMISNNQQGLCIYM